METLLILMVSFGNFDPFYWFPHYRSYYLTIANRPLSTFMQPKFKTKTPYTTNPNVHTKVVL